MSGAGPRVSGAPMMHNMHNTPPVVIFFQRGLDDTKEPAEASDPAAAQRERLRWMEDALAKATGGEGDEGSAEEVGEPRSNSNELSAASPPRKGGGAPQTAQTRPQQQPKPQQQEQEQRAVRKESKGPEPAPVSAPTEPKEQKPAPAAQQQGQQQQQQQQQRVPTQRETNTAPAKPTAAASPPRPPKGAQQSNVDDADGWTAVTKQKRPAEKKKEADAPQGEARQHAAAVAEFVKRHGLDNRTAMRLAELSPAEQLIVINDPQGLDKARNKSSVVMHKAQLAVQAVRQQQQRECQSAAQPAPDSAARAQRPAQQPQQRPPPQRAAEPPPRPRPPATAAPAPAPRPAVRPAEACAAAAIAATAAAAASAAASASAVPASVAAAAAALAFSAATVPAPPPRRPARRVPPPTAVRLPATVEAQLREHADPEPPHQPPADPAPWRQPSIPERWADDEVADDITPECQSTVICTVQRPTPTSDIGVSLAVQSGRCVVESVVEGGPGAAAGIQPGMRIVSVAGQSIAKAEHVRRLFREAGPVFEVELSWQGPAGTHHAHRSPPRYAAQDMCVPSPGGSATDGLTLSDTTLSEHSGRCEPPPPAGPYMPCAADGYPLYGPPMYWPMQPMGHPWGPMPPPPPAMWPPPQPLPGLGPQNAVLGLNGVWQPLSEQPPPPVAPAPYSQPYPPHPGYAPPANGMPVSQLVSPPQLQSHPVSLPSPVAAEPASAAGLEGAMSEYRAALENARTCADQLAALQKCSSAGWTQDAGRALSAAQCAEAKAQREANRTRAALKHRLEGARAMPPQDNQEAACCAAAAAQAEQLLGESQRGRRSLAVAPPPPASPVAPAPQPPCSRCFRPVGGCSPPQPRRRARSASPVRTMWEAAEGLDRESLDDATGSSVRVHTPEPCRPASP